MVKGKFFILLVNTFIGFFLLTLSTVFALVAVDIDKSGGYNKPILDTSLNFSAKLDNGYVYTSWEAFNKDEKLKYYKVVRSSRNSDPVYPDDGYIKYLANINDVEYKDTKPLYGTAYYRVCAITYENNRYCSSVVKIYNEKEYSTTIPETCTSWFDGCNTCGVENGKTTYCTLMYCEQKSEPKCLRYKEEKPVACTKEYSPVCGYKDGQLKTYSNKCMLGADKAYYKYSGKCRVEIPVIPKTCTSWYDGCNTCGVENGKTTFCTEMACSVKKEAKCLKYSETPTICTMEYAPVCGYKDGKYKTYSNKCMLKTANAYYKYSGECKTKPDNSYLSEALRKRADLLIKGFIKKLEAKDYSDEKKIVIIDGVISKLNELKTKKPLLSNLINYLVKLLKEYRKDYDNSFSDIEDIFDIK